MGKLLWSLRGFIWETSCSHEKQNKKKLLKKKKVNKNKKEVKKEVKIKKNESTHSEIRYLLWSFISDTPSSHDKQNEITVTL